MKTKYLILVCIGAILCTSAFVPEPRLLSASVPVMERVTKQVKKHIADVPYIVKAEPIEEAIEIETVEVEQEDVIEEAEEYYEEEYYEEVTYEEESYETSEAWSYIGTYEITAYEWTGNPCANGNYPTEGWTVACNDLPLGTTVYIDGVGYRTVEDTGGGGYGWMDLYLGDVSSCYEWGRQYRDVWIVE